MSEPNPFGNVRVELSISGQWAITLLTSGWSTEEKQALLDGDKDATEALVDEAVQRTLAKPYNVETDLAYITMRGEMATVDE